MALRDLVTFELCQKHLSEIFSKENILQTAKCTKDIAEKSRQTLKLTAVRLPSPLVELGGRRRL